MTCRPGGASDGSTLVATTQSPEILESHALGGVAAALGEVERGHEGEEERCDAGQSCGMPETRGSSESTKFTFAQGPSILIPATFARNSPGKSDGSTRPRKVRFGSALRAPSAPQSRSHPRGPRRVRGALWRCAHGGSRADLDAERPRRGGHRLCDRAHAAEHVAVEALTWCSPPEQVEEQAERRAGLVGPAVLSVEAVGEHQRLDLVRRVVAVEEVAEAARQEGHHAGDLLAGNRCAVAFRS
jgi:hypothetical protein